MESVPVEEILAFFSGYADQVGKEGTWNKSTVVPSSSCRVCVQN